MDYCYWLISIPEKFNEKIITFEDFTTHLSCPTHDYAQVFKFVIPHLKAGNLDSLICQSEDVAKLDDHIKESILKIPEILKAILENDVYKCIQQLTIDNKSIEHYLQTFQWDIMKYRTDLSINVLIQMIENELFSIEELKVKYQSYNQAKNNLSVLERKYIGDLSQCSLTNIVKKEHVVQESEYLETALISVPIFNKNLWLKSYETLTPMVVCRSAFEISKDNKYILYSVVVFKKYIQEFKQKCREIKCIPRDFEYKDDLFIEEENILENARKKENKLWSEVLRLAHTSFSDTFQAWIHLKAIRVFIESILRYGNPPNFVSIIIKGHQRSLLSNTFIPSDIFYQDSKKIKTGHDLLIKAGFLRQSSSGIYTILPLALRVQEKIEKIIDKFLYKINASKISLPNLLTSNLWKKTKRWDLLGKELFKLKNRKGVDYCLSPTHEEEITNLIAKEILSWRHLPLKLYQTGKKFRDEIRPRRGLLRGCEFIMNDLYTFDKSKQDAIQTYELVCNTYKEIFSEFGLPVIMAEANSGNIGGYLSHEFHTLFPLGEDTLIICQSCGYVSNEEFALAKQKHQISFKLENCSCFYIKNASNIIIGVAYIPIDCEINVLFINRIMKNITSETITITFKDNTEYETNDYHKSEIIHILDTNFNLDSFIYPNYLKKFQNKLITACIIKAKENHLCYKCSQPLKSKKSIELAHTFYLGTKYSSVLSATYASEGNKGVLPIEMGCYGIGVSRILSSLAEVNKDDKGLVWPITIAPWKAVIISSSDLNHLLYEVYDMIVYYFEEDSIIIDDRKNRGFVWKMKDSDLIGFPYIIIIGKHWEKTGELEVQIRKTGEKVFIKLENIKNIVQ
ncbi:hypothetical protein PMAC_002842 [Pneumocystis sp. 'macacae']|nr:hypothetical protein PMAC_002842 [Pneumocystis sp. 'macacae']